MASISIQHTMGNLPPNPCFTSEQQRANAYDAAQQFSLPINFTTAIVQQTAPGPDDRDKIWVMTDGAGRYVATLLFSNGSWQMNAPAAPYLEIGDFKSYDPGLQSPVAPWFACDGSVPGVPDFRGRVLMGTGQRVLPAGSTDTNTNFPYGVVGGSETVAITMPQIPSHTHPPLAGETGFLEIGPGTIAYGAGSPGASTVGITTGPTGGQLDGTTQGHPNLPPYYPVAWKQWRPDLT